MPAISTMVYPAPAYVRVEVNWADVGAATGAAVYRVDCVTRERLPLRPYVSFDGDFIDLSCGYAIFWDTEPQLDRCIYYCTQAIDSSGNVVTAPAANLVTDTFTRVLVDSWGSTDNGLSYTLSGGTVPGNYDVTGTVGTHTLDTTNVARHSWVDVGTSGFDAYVTVAPTVVALTQPIIIGIIGRATNGTLLYSADAQFGTANDVNLFVRRDELGTPHVDLGNAAAGVYVAASKYTIRFQGIGNQLRAKAWESTLPEPVAWMVSVTDSTYLTQENVGVHSNRVAGNTNGTITVTFDNFLVTDPCADPEPIESCSDDLVAPSSGEFRLGDPMRPCNDVVLQFTGQADPDCVPTQGIFFANMSDEDAEANSGTFAPVNSVFPIGIYRARRSLAATLTTLTRTFADRDAMRQLNAPGGPLLLRGPAQYGIYDRYMLVGNVSEHRQLSDHRIQPRAVVMPHVQLDYSYGPSQGVCGTRVEDLCDIYPTWDAIVAAGLTYADLLRGKASNDTPIPDTVERTWAQVNSTYANWTAVNAGNTDWDDLRDGA